MNSAFEQYRTNTPPFNIARIIGGVFITLIVWVAFTFVVVTALSVLRTIGVPLSQHAFELWAMLTGFGGIWVGIWLVMRFLHKQPLASLYGANQRIDWRQGLKGFTAVVLSSIVAEVLLSIAGYSVFEWSGWSWGAWLLLLPLLALVTWVQTSAEELLFRGYLMRGLASSRRNPWVWAVIPSVLFVLLHISPDMSGSLAVVELAGIASITALLVFTVLRTGNLGGAMGVHFGNNIFIFALLSHEEKFNSFSMATGTSTDAIAATSSGTLALLLITVASPALAALLLADPRSPIKICGKQQEPTL